jgi:integrase
MTKHQSETTKRRRRPSLSDKMVAALPKKRKRYVLPDPEQRGHYVRVMPDGANVYCAVARDPYAKQIWHTISSADVLTIAEARERAREAIKRIKEGKPAVEPPPVKPETFKAVAESWRKRHVAAKGLRSAGEIERVLEKYVYPHWGERDFVGIKRSDITSLLDLVEDNHGSPQADAVLAITRTIANWQAGRVDDYVSPFIRGMRRINPKATARARTLNDDELRAVWKQAEGNGTFGAIIRLLLLTGQRREKVATMKWADVRLDGVWTIPTAEREKGNAGTLQLPPQALSIIATQPRISGNPHVFAGRGDGCIDISQSKRPFDAKLPKMPRWVLHDLRRTARSLMSRAGVRPDIAERVLGHMRKGVEGTYDRYAYFKEKSDALAKLATLVDGIVNPRDNVLPMSKQEKKRR